MKQMTRFSFEQQRKKEFSLEKLIKANKKERKKL